jgi:DNA recombination protein RmuC
MLIPNEPAFIEALRADNEIWSEAYRKKVVISSPSNIFALLKLVSVLWTQDAQRNNQQKILQLSASLYDKLCLMTETIDDVGKNLDRAQKKYDELRTRMQGKGGVISLGEKIRALGLTPRKEIAESWLRQTDMTDDKITLLGEDDGNEA